MPLRIRFSCGAIHHPKIHVKERFLRQKWVAQVKTRRAKNRKRLKVVMEESGGAREREQVRRDSDQKSRAAMRVLPPTCPMD
jgi:hypothetical protein